MEATTPARRPVVAARRFGYSVAVVVNTVLLYMVNVEPGWQVVPFLTEDTWRVLALVNLSLAAGVAVNLVYMLRDPAWLRALGELVTTVISFVVLVRISQVFPFAFDDSAVDWALIARVVLVVSLVGTGIAVIVNAVTLAREAAGGAP